MHRRESWRALAGIAALALGACTTQVSPLMQQRAEAPIPAGHGRVIVVRPANLGDAITRTGPVHLLVDGRDQGELVSRSYQVMDLVPGVHQVRLRRPEQSIFTALNHDGSQEVLVAPGATVYLRCFTFRDNHLNTVNLILAKTTERRGQSELESLKATP